MRRLAEFALKKLIGVKGDIRHVVFNENGRRFDCLVPDDALWGVVTDVLMTDTYERGGIRLQNFTGTVIDAGAHSGLFALRASGYASKVVALEAHPTNFALLIKNLARNGAKNVQPIDRALWVSSGEVQLFEGADSMSPSVVNPAETRYRVASLGLGEMVGSAGTVDLLKLDIEGAEFAVLKKASDDTLRRINAFAVELHLRGRERQESLLIERLQSLGFRVTVLPPLFYSWKQAMTRLVSNWGRLRNQIRLKLTVMLVYTLVAIASWFFDLRSRLNVEGLKFLYATRE